MMKQFYILALCLLIFNVACRTGGLEPEEAMRLYQLGKYEAALAKYLELIEDAPTNSEYSFYVGQTLAALKQCEEALPYLEGGRMSDALAHTAIKIQARCLQEMGRFPSAVSLLREGITQYPEAEGLELALAKAHAVDGQATAAEAVYLNILKNSNVKAEEIYYAARFYEQKLGDGAQALKLYEQYLKLADAKSYRYAEVRSRRRLLLLTGTFAASDPTGQGLAAQAWSLMMEGRYTLAAERMEKYAEPNADTRYMQGYCYYRAGFYKKSLPYLWSAVRERPRENRYRATLARALKLSEVKR